MQILCKVSNVFSDVRCPVCGQGFLVYWTRVASHSRNEQRDLLLGGLRGHHNIVTSAEAHPPAFHLADAATPILPYDDGSLLPSPGLLGVYS